MRQQIGCLEQEVVELDGTISNLMKSINDKELDHRAQEETAGAIGYHKAKCDLKDSKEEAEQMNNLKEKEMHTISEIVTQMKHILKQKQSKLQPMVSAKLSILHKGCLHSSPSVIFMLTTNTD